MSTTGAGAVVVGSLTLYTTLQRRFCCSLCCVVWVLALKLFEQYEGDHSQIVVQAEGRSEGEDVAECDDFIL